MVNSGTFSPKSDTGTDQSYLFTLNQKEVGSKVSTLDIFEVRSA